MTNGAASVAGLPRDGRGNAGVAFVTAEMSGFARRATSPPVACPLLSQVSGDTMNDPNFEIINVAQARRVLTDGDIQSDVAFQNDVNRLLASLEDLCDALESLPGAQG